MYYGNTCILLQAPSRGKAMMDLPTACIVCLAFCQFVAAAAQGVTCKAGCHPKNGFCEHPGECRCLAGWKGQFCNQCISFPGCLHGSCTEPWQCVCEEGWIGALCDIDIHPCAAKPCSSSSTCIETGDGGYICLCAPGFTGQNCLLKKGPCLANGSPCQNGGTCFDNNGYASLATCRCPPGFTGNTCADVDKNKTVKADTQSHNVSPYHRPFKHQGHEVLKITVKETIHNMDPLLKKSQVICFIVLGLLTCLIVLITTGIIFLSKCETWFANAKYRHLLQKKRDFYMKSNREGDVKIIFPEKVKIANYSRNYTSI
ncbi:protein delta homolog 1 isoform X3 [Spea bombifrons]|uniref:protein delta homolog 1 isoform X3 n=1 Tax=Spea bombifrons TaxID=233779 RepID=UPI00234BEAA2|nr:protein delta homolog 1 isoform X3 [Spea bombifrons]